MAKRSDPILPVPFQEKLPRNPSEVPSHPSSKGQPETVIETPKDFIDAIWEAAKKAAWLLNTDPRILVAQAALETNWGKKILAGEGGKSSYNLFNIKADKAWKKKSMRLNALEKQHGQLIHEPSKFRMYDSFEESCLDYVQFLKTNKRYQQALSLSEDPKLFVEALQKAGYATDSQYAEKIMRIFSSQRLSFTEI